MDSFIQDLLGQSSPSPDWSVHSMTMNQQQQQQQAFHSLPPQLQCIPKPMDSSHAMMNDDFDDLDLQDHDQPVKIRKKPGRKPNPASPALRKAQNRAAQRAFRERKERHLRDLETTIRTLRDQRQQTIKELNSTKTQLDSFRAENWYLKGLVLTLQFICLHHSIQIPTHSPYLTEEALSEIARSSPHTIEAYVNAYMRNNVNLKPTMATHLANSYQQQQKEEEEFQNFRRQRQQQRRRQGGEEEYDEEEEDDQRENDSRYSNNNYKNEYCTDDLSSSASPHHQHQDDPYGVVGSSGPMSMDEDSEMSFVKQEPRDDELNEWLHSASPSASPQPQQQKEKTPQQQLQPNSNDENDTSSLSAIQKIRLQLRIQSALASIGSSAARLQPTLLQLSISHDPRIDLIPTPHMRDRMIIFRDQMDYDRCFTMLLNGAVYHGGDPTMSESWELPPEFFSEFWFLTIDYDRRKTNKWRRVKGLPEIGPSSLDELQKSSLSSSSQQLQSNPNTWPNNNNNNDASTGSQFVDDMPPLQPISNNPNNYLMSPPSDFDKLNHSLYQIMGTDPQTRRPERAPTLGAIMELMSSMTTSDNNAQEAT
ncbi:hypothetical protein BDA99DRAFT_500029 [Phascolomyces articulosus]|uniref:BZIP domain-containing protein n=1 Tax=Phascolomyces articulosus TaxID=60185 RepID=A0AAD5KQR0_9FUNG|nr:hypothetical protein BDA99DRAFT_500029 [Phascolomyces articulosus]